MDLGLERTTVLVTGAGQGIGTEIGLCFAREGANVVFHYNHSKAGAEAAVDAARATGADALALRADITDEGSLRELREKIHDRFPAGTAVLVNNAAFTGLPKKFVDTDLDESSKEIQVTMEGMMAVTKTMLPDIIESGHGAIVNIAGESGRVGESLAAVTSATRAAALGFTKALAKEVARDAVRVNAVTLGLTRTPTTQNAVFDRVRPDLLERIKRAYPLRRFADPADIAPLVVFLASSRAAWITGQTYGINGGYVMT